MEEKMIKEPAQSQRRGLLRKVFWAVAGVVGAGSLLGAKAAPAHANGSEGPTTFTATGGATAVSALSESGAGVTGFSESGAGVWANSHTGIGLSAQSGTGVSIEAYSASSVAVDARSDSGTGLHASSHSNGIGAILENTSGVAVQIKGRIQVQGDCIGQAFMRSGTLFLEVNAPAATPDSLILLTPLGYWEGGVLSVSRKTGGFTINAHGSSLADVTIAYLIVN